LVLLILLAVAAVYAISSRHITRTYDFPDSPVRAATDSASLARGRHLVEAVGKCGECHAPDLGGRTLVDAPAMGRLSATNLTTGRGGLGDYSDADFERALRHGVGRGGRPLLFMPSEAFALLSDADLAAMIGYLRTVPPVDREMPVARVGPVARALYLGGNFPLLPVTLIDHTASHDAPQAGVTREYGEYLATIGGCRACHGLQLAGDANPDAPDITVGRLGGWTEQDFFRALREGRRPDGSVIDPAKMPWVRSGQMTDEEIRAVWLYLRSVPTLAMSRPAVRVAPRITTPPNMDTSGSSRMARSSPN
jgi:mono/diheme cytochrome c family protein